MRVDKTLSELWSLVNHHQEEEVCEIAQMAVNTIKKLQEENEQLQSVVQVDRHEYRELTARYEKVKEENEFLAGDVQVEKEYSEELEKKLEKQQGSVKKIKELVFYCNGVAEVQYEDRTEEVITNVYFLDAILSVETESSED